MLRCLLVVNLNQLFNEQLSFRWFEVQLGSCDVTVMNNPICQENQFQSVGNVTVLGANYWHFRLVWETRLMVALNLVDGQDLCPEMTQTRAEGLLHWVTYNTALRDCLIVWEGCSLPGIRGWATRIRQWTRRYVPHALTDLAQIHQV